MNKTYQTKNGTSLKSMDGGKYDGAKVLVLPKRSDPTSKMYMISGDTIDCLVSNLQSFVCSCNCGARQCANCREAEFLLQRLEKKS